MGMCCYNNDTCISNLDIFFVFVSSPLASFLPAMNVLHRGVDIQLKATFYRFIFFCLFALLNGFYFSVCLRLNKREDWVSQENELNGKPHKKSAQT
jgi:hypothetical protein